MAPHSSTLAWKIHGQRSLVGYSPWGPEESDTTERHFLKFFIIYFIHWASSMVQWVKNLPAMQKTQKTEVRSLGWDDPLDEEMASLHTNKFHSSILIWKIPWTEEPGGLQSMGSQRIRHNWATNQNFFSPYIYALPLESLFHLHNPSLWVDSFLKARLCWFSFKYLCWEGGHLCSYLQQLWNIYPVEGKVM